jgi:hypothetical protein
MGLALFSALAFNPTPDPFFTLRSVRVEGLGMSPAAERAAAAKRMASAMDSGSRGPGAAGAGGTTQGKENEPAPMAPMAPEPPVAAALVPVQQLPDGSAVLAPRCEL